MPLTVLPNTYDSDALDEGIAFLEATGETMEEVGARIDIGAAAGEVFHHLLIDKYFELDRDLDVLFEYCGEILAAPSPVPLLVSCYLPRLMLTTRVARASDVLLFNNMQLIPLLEKLPVEVVEEPDATINANTVAWEIFAQILAQQLDPLDAERTERLARVRMRHYDEVKSLMAKCLFLAEEMSPPDRLQDVIGAVDRFLRHNVNQEIAGLFELNRASVDAFVESVLIDEKSWLTTAASIASVFSGHPLFTAGAALATVSSVGAKAAKSAFDRRRKLRASDYRVLYRIGRR